MKSYGGTSGAQATRLQKWSWATGQADCFLLPSCCAVLRRNDPVRISKGAGEIELIAP